MSGGDREIPARAKRSCDLQRNCLETPCYAKEWLSAETRSTAKEKLGEARPGHREELKELGCEGLARSRSELRWKSLDGEERQWNSIDQICVGKA